MASTTQQGHQDKNGIQIDGITPLAFLLRLAESYMMSINLKSIGPRINALAAFHFPTNSKAITLFSGQDEASVRNECAQAKSRHTFSG